MSEGELSAPEILRSDHRIDVFNSGVPSLDQWLKRRTLANEVTGATRTFVTCAESRVVGFYSLAAASIIHSVATPRIRRNIPDLAPAVVHALSDDAKRSYLKFGFRESPIEPMTLMVTLEELEREVGRSPT